MFRRCAMVLSVASVLVFGPLGGHLALAVTYTAIDLTPGGFTSCLAYDNGTWGSGTPAGRLSVPARPRAETITRCSGAAPAGDAVDLNSLGFTESYAQGTSNGTTEVGYGSGRGHGGTITRCSVRHGRHSYRSEPQRIHLIACLRHRHHRAATGGFGSGAATGNCDHALLWSLTSARRSI